MKRKGNDGGGDGGKRMEVVMVEKWRGSCGEGGTELVKRTRVVRWVVAFAWV